MTPALGAQLLEVGERIAAGFGSETQAHRPRLPRLDERLQMRRRLRPLCLRVRGRDTAADDDVVEGVLHVRARVDALAEALRIRLVLGEEQRAVRVDVEVALAEARVLRSDRRPDPARA
jgi:hypothetical protein